MKNKYDFIVVGAGLAGIYSALKASEYGTVALLTKTTIEISNSYLAQGGIAAALNDDDSPQLHIEDTLKAGAGLCNVEAVEILVNEGIDCLKELISMGMKFDTENGKLSFGLEGGHSRKRILHAGGDATGKEIVNFILKFIYNNNNITIFENTLVFKLDVVDNECHGVYVYNHNEKKSFYLSGKSVILATGGFSAVYSFSTNPHTSTGEGINLAYDAGAEIESIEFIQFHPTSFYTGSEETFLISEAVRGEGAYIVNHEGLRFLQDLDKSELSTRDIVSEAIYEELKRTKRKNVFLLMNHLDADKIKNRFSHIYNEALKYGVDITKDPVPIAPAAHYTVGGIKTDINGRTNISRLYAVGETASTGVHGANRLASNSLLECLVFGKRVVDYAVKNDKDLKDYSKPEVIDFNVDENLAELFIDIKNKIAELLWNNAGILRSKAILNSALKEITKLSNEFINYRNEYYSSRINGLLNLAGMIIKSALIREESRGCHRRSDFPYPNEKFNATIVHKKETSPEFRKL
ncbi:L-aspartate oxidase [Melioribacter sp. OK-6-Me]|uniref:L-aspartate oxidase n=1 Tax=unclassified Melioribacter TaxID=2627329 RepID=UPI003ED9ADC8